MQESYYDYDIFGSPITGNYTTGADYGYLGKPYDSITGLYNYGYRDYSPQTVRFTTVDPIRDGANWFTYVNNDPVNYVDLWGLLASEGHINWNAVLDGVQAGLDVAGLVPGFGDLADGVNALISLGRGDVAGTVDLAHNTSNPENGVTPDGKGYSEQLPYKSKDHFDSAGWGKVSYYSLEEKKNK